MAKNQKSAIVRQNIKSQLDDLADQENLTAEQLRKKRAERKRRQEQQKKEESK